jgi:hypothetical protein
LFSDTKICFGYPVLREGWKWKSFFFAVGIFAEAKKKIETDSPTRAVAMLWRGTRPKNRNLKPNF